MITSDHNNSTNNASTKIATLGDLRDFIRFSDLKSDQKSLIRSAIKRADEIVGRGMLDLPADPRVVLEQLEQISPDIAGMSYNALANLKSRLRTAFRLAEPRLEKARGRPPLTDVWRTLKHSMSVSQQRYSARFFRYASGNGWLVEDISDDHIERFGEYLRENTIVTGWEEVARNTVRAWNEFASSATEVRMRQLTPPPLKRTSYWIAIDQWPTGLRADLEALLASIGSPDPFGGRKVRPRKASTVEQYRYQIISVVSALVDDGKEFRELARLADVYQPVNFERALRALHRRAGNRVTSTMRTIVHRARVVGEFCELPAEAIAEIEELRNSIDAVIPGKRRQLTPKNRALLDRLEDQKFSDLILTLPQMVFRDAQAESSTLRAAKLARAALAIELLLVCSMRRENLVRLKLGSSIKTYGSESERRWVVHLTADDVKNGEELRFPLPRSTVDILEAYLRRWRPSFCNSDQPWLFPGQDDDAIEGKALARVIQSISHRYLGVAISPHQFRHISAESYLLAAPDKLAVVSQHLGHRDINTTRNYYARSKQREASRDYQEHVLRARATASDRLDIRRRSSSRTKSRREDTP